MTKMMKTFALLLVAALPLCLFSSCSDDDDEVVSSQSGTIGKYDYVDLGLSVKWATCNVAASSSSDYGDFIAWGEIRRKSSYLPTNSTTYGVLMGDISGNFYDAARSQWGYTWRMPTRNEMEELIAKCSWEYTIQNSRKGYTITGPSGGSIFLPCGGCFSAGTHYDGDEGGWYWTSTPAGDSSNHNSYNLYFSEEGMAIFTLARYCGLFVRPVSD